VWREAENIQPDDTPPNVHILEPVRDPDTGHVISSVVAAALCIKPRGPLMDRQTRKVDALKQGSAAFAMMRRLAMRFNASCAAGIRRRLDEWITPISPQSCVLSAFCARISMRSKIR